MARMPPLHAAAAPAGCDTGRRRLMTRYPSPEPNSTMAVVALPASRWGRPASCPSATTGPGPPLHGPGGHHCCSPSAAPPLSAVAPSPAPARQGFAAGFGAPRYYRRAFLSVCRAAHSLRLPQTAHSAQRASKSAAERPRGPRGPASRPPNIVHGRCLLKLNSVWCRLGACEQSATESAACSPRATVGARATARWACSAQAGRGGLKGTDRTARPAP